MKALLQILLICFASSAGAQTLPLPPRAADAPDGDAFARSIGGLDLEVRDDLIAREFLAGNAPGFLRTLCAVTVTNVAAGRTNVGTFFAAPEYLAIGSGDNYLLAPIAPATAQRIADALGCILPTRKMVDAIYAAAAVKFTPSPIPPTGAMTTVPVFLQHNETVRAQRQALGYPPGALAAGHKKDVVISARLATVTNKVAIYGWHRTNGVAIQHLYLGHVSWWVDYSQCIRLVSQTMLVNGEKKQVADVLSDPDLCGLVSDEGVVKRARYPTNAAAPPLTRVSGGQGRPPGGILPDAPFPTGFTVTTNFGELTREIRLPDDVRIVINAPAQETFVTNKPVRLVFFALPNGNTIEQTIGKQTQAGADWHFNIQHIGAQTRWLRQHITNQTLVVAYLEAGSKSWPTWRKTHDDRRIAEIFAGVRGIFPAYPIEVVLASHSGGGSLIFGYLNAAERIPDDVKRIAFLDSNYAYNPTNHAGKIQRWLAASPEHRLCVLAYQDYLGLLEGKPFVSEAGGTWGRSRLMLRDLGTAFRFTSQTNNGMETYTAAGGQIEFRMKENPEHKILHTVQVERNGFIHALLSGTSEAGKGYEYFGERVYGEWIGE